MLRDKNSKLAARLFGFGALMLALSFAAVPAYDMFCKITGFDGTTQRAVTLPAAEAIKERSVSVSFTANVQRDLPWTFTTGTPALSVRLGAPARATFKVTNNAEHAITGVATYNVTPEKAGVYFQKVQCFCFTEHTLQPGETQEFPILFFVDPAFDDDINLKDIKTLTLSYTYFEAKQKNKLGLE